MNFYIGASLKNHELVNYVAKKLIANGWKHTYNWAENLLEEETLEDMVKFATLEKRGVANADVVIIILPAGRGSHVELGMSLALNKKTYLYSEDGKEFEEKDTICFYQTPGIIRLSGNIDEAIEEIMKN